MKWQERTRRLVTGTLAAAVVLAPAFAAAQAEPERPTLKLGPFEIRPRLLLNNIGVDYNVFNDNTDPKQDFTFTAAPDLEVSVHPGRLRVAFTSGSELVYFQQYTSERSINRTVGGRADLDLTFLKPFFTASSAHTSARPNSEIDVRARHYPRTYSAGTSVKLASRTSMTFTGRLATEFYDESAEFRGEQLSTLLDNKTTAYEAALSFELTPFTTLSLVTGIEEQRFDHSPTARRRQPAHRPDGDVQPARTDYRHGVDRLSAVQRARPLAAGLQRPRLLRRHRDPPRRQVQDRHPIHPGREVLL